VGGGYGRKGVVWLGCVGRLTEPEELLGSLWEVGGGVMSFSSDGARALIGWG